jgi:hypothetical protein
MKGRFNIPITLSPLHSFTTSFLWQAGIERSIGCAPVGFGGGARYRSRY